MTLNEAKALCEAAGYEVIRLSSIRELAISSAQDASLHLREDMPVQIMDHTRDHMARSLAEELMKLAHIVQRPPVESAYWRGSLITYETHMRVIL